MVDDSIYIADTDTDSKSARVRMQARQFAAERRNRKAYAPSIDMTIDQRVDIGGTLLEARKRIAQNPRDWRNCLSLLSVNDSFPRRAYCWYQSTRSLIRHAKTLSRSWSNVSVL